MKSSRLSLLTAICSVALTLGSPGFYSQAFAQSTPSAAKEAKPQPSQAELEEKFIKTLTNATFTGRWCLIKDGALTPEKQDKYSIASVTKLQGDKWTINARMEYEGQEFVLPIPAEVKWAGDTAVICIDNLSIMPGGAGGTYTARVLIQDGAYAGTWGGGKEKMGLISGAIQSGAK